MNFRIKLLAAMMLVISAITALGLYYAQRNAEESVERELRREFQAQIEVLHSAQDVRHGALAERCRALVSKPRLHAALEDDALDLLYPSARDELRDVMQPSGAKEADTADWMLHARFYRFLGADGRVLPPPNQAEVGEMTPAEEAKLALPGISEQQQFGYFKRVTRAGAEVIDEVIAMPILSSETHLPIASLVMGFPLAGAAKPPVSDGIKSGLWLDGELYLPGSEKITRELVGAEVSRAIAEPSRVSDSFSTGVEGASYLLFFKQLNPGSLFRPAYEVCLYPLADSIARQKQVRRRILGVAALLLLAGLAASHVASSRLAQPVQELEVASEENRVQRVRAEAALESTSEELQRSARFAADASHQLKTPVTVLRTGLEELLKDANLTPLEVEEISTLIHQTYRLTGIIEDLLLLARMEAGRVRLNFARVNLSQIIAGWLDDLSTLPDTLDLTVDTDVPAEICILGEQRYTTLIIQNLLVNARKYNRRGGRIQVAAREEGDLVILTIGNTGRSIPEAARERIFERFHRGTAGENVPGHGLGLNLARELARIHGGDLRFMRSDEDWSEFQVQFQRATPISPKKD